MAAQTCVEDNTVFGLWGRLKELEEEGRFDGRPYPEGMSCFPFRLIGQGFFPGGDGLWRDDSELSVSKPGILPESGAVFIGNDFGTLTSFRRLQVRGFENVPTWRHLKARITHAGLPTEATFFTNAIIGLREDGSALDKRTWRGMPNFATFCGDFLRFQLRTLNPRLVVVMGPDARAAFQSFASEACNCQVLFSRHPYADFSLQKDLLEAEITALAQAWRAS
jgi:hypothetical protein